MELRLIKQNLYNYRRNWIGLLSTGILLSTLLSGCKTVKITNTQQLTIETSIPSLSLTPTLSLTAEPTPTLSPTSNSTPQPTSEVLSPTDDLCRLKDSISIDDISDISLGFISIDSNPYTILYGTYPGDGGIPCLDDPLTDKNWFKRKIKGNDIEYVPSETLATKGKVKWLYPRSLHAYLTEECGLSEEKAKEVIEGIKTYKDLRIWYEETFGEQIVVMPWEELVGLKNNDYNSELEIANKVLELKKYRNEHKISV